MRNVSCRESEMVYIGVGKKLNCFVTMVIKTLCVVF